MGSRYSKSTKPNLDRGNELEGASFLQVYYLAWHIQLTVHSAFKIGALPTKMVGIWITDMLISLIELFYIVPINHHHFLPYNYIKTVICQFTIINVLDSRDKAKEKD